MIAAILLPALALAGLGLLFGLGLAYTLKLFSIEVDPAVALIISKLPGANCGACGRAGCSGFAEALRRGEAVPSACPATKDGTARQIAAILGVEYEAQAKKAAVLSCGGGRNARDEYVYQGIRRCQAAFLMLGGQKACAWGCLGFGDCVRACPFGAIRTGEEGVPEVDREKCTACGTCLKVCPKQLFTLVASPAAVAVACSSREKGRAVTSVCSVGCIACGKCVRECPAGALSLLENVARIDYAKCTACLKCVTVCPRKIIRPLDKVPISESQISDRKSQI